MTDREWTRSYASHRDFYEAEYGQHITSVFAVEGGVTLIEADQSAGDWSDAPVPDLVFARLASEPVQSSIDLGAGRFGSLQQPGEPILVSPNAGTSIQMEARHVCRVVALPYADLLSMTQDDPQLLPQDGDFGSLHSEFVRDPLLTGLLKQIWQEGVGGGSHGALFMDGAVLQLAAVLGRLRQTPGITIAKGGLALWRQRQATDYLAAHLADDVSLETLSAVAGLSPFHFARTFKLSTGRSPHAYLRHIRAERAKTMLVETSLSISEIAAEVGYETPQAFARMFRGEVGASPSVYRNDRRR